ncbi:MAG: YbaK/EbsC family protein [Betaproteobacteria bacterium]|nr:YbaK/EbsC family protein [Betaproteobacteria bacterium]
MSDALSASAQRAQAAVLAAGIEARVTEHETAARTSAQAAETLGCSVAEIAKSLVFRGAHSNEPVLVVASGEHRIDLAKLAALIGEPVHKPDAAYVRQVTGYAIGGIPPLGHARALPTLIDQSLLRFAKVYAAGGTPNAMFPVSPLELVRATAGRVVDIHEEAS